MSPQSFPSYSTSDWYNHIHFYTTLHLQSDENEERAKLQNTWPKKCTVFDPGEKQKDFHWDPDIRCASYLEPVYCSSSHAIVHVLQSRSLQAACT